MTHDAGQDAETPFDLEATVAGLVGRNALFVVNHSGGKDSQAMFAKLLGMVPREQIVVVHADLGHVEWEGAQEHIRDTIDGLPLLVCRNNNKTFVEMMERRGMFPSPTTRQCTSDFKRGPIERTIRHYLKDNPQFGGLVVNCVGLRAQESPGRRKQKPFRLNEGNSVAGREWYDLLPIHDMQIEEVWKTISEAGTQDYWQTKVPGGQKPHAVYSQGMSRFSCKLCIMATDADLATAARLDPKNYAMYVGLERKFGRTMMMPRNVPVPGGKPKMVARSLEDITGIKADFVTYPEYYHPEVDFSGNVEADRARQAAKALLAEAAAPVAEPLVDDEPLPEPDYEPGTQLSFAL
jgi:3''-phosphoadenosine 5''-phosphosulfate sulfotransferase (PAPS reductase)/FAD synthetase and related enzymes